MIKTTISKQIIPSLAILSFAESAAKRLSTDSRMTLLFVLIAVSFKKINCKKGINIPIETTEKIILNIVERK